MQVGDYQVDFVSDGAFALDGGAMFGVVPRPLWARTNPPDERNRIDMGLNCMLLRGHGRIVLVDSGIGDKFPAKEADIYRVDHSHATLIDSLLRLGVHADQVTDVVITHLHFDHAGGLTHRRDGDLWLTFPHARHYLQREHYQWATHPTVKDRASFLPENYEPVREAGLLQLLDGPEAVLPAMELVLLHGHTRALQGLLVQGDPCLFYPSDLVPTSSHLRLPFSMGYDNFPLTTIEEKQTWLPRAAREGWSVVFEHDPRLIWSRIEERNGDFRVRPAEVAA
ncbi:MAG: MBL fold metallo-hydrolase [Candidatus Eremiobacterota bacterium]